MLAAFRAACHVMAPSLHATKSFHADVAAKLLQLKLRDNVEAAAASAAAAAAVAVAVAVYVVNAAKCVRQFGRRQLCSQRQQLQSH